MTTAPPKPPLPNQYTTTRPLSRRLRLLVASFGYAFEGLWYLFRTQPNAQIHGLITLCVLALAAFLPLARWEWLVLILTIGLVFFAEAINTALEALVDLASPEFHPLAKIAKDVGAGAVVLCAVAAVAIGCVIFVPHLWPLVEWLFSTDL